MIKALIFDLGKTIVPFDFKRGYAAMEHRCPYPAAEIPKRIGATDLVVRFESGQVEPRKFVEELCGILDLDMTYDEFCHIWFSIFLPETLISESWLAALGQRYPLLLLSNTNAIHFEMLDAHYPILRLFRHRVLSHQVGAMKPSPIIYEAAIAKAGCRPGECFFTDDVAAYVEGACQCGMDAVQFHTQQQLERDLRARGVEW
jgi:glucose-1-phosphatase